MDSRAKVESNGAQFQWVLFYSLVHMLCHGEVEIKQTEHIFLISKQATSLLICNSALIELRKHCTEDILFDSELHHSKCCL